MNRDRTARELLEWLGDEELDGFTTYDNENGIPLECLDDDWFEEEEEEEEA